MNLKVCCSERRRSGSLARPKAAAERSALRGNTHFLPSSCPTCPLRHNTPPFAAQVTKAFVKLLKMKAQTDQLLFPEMLGKCFIVNTPSLFSYVWGMFSPLVDARTRSKVCRCVCRVCHVMP